MHIFSAEKKNFFAHANKKKLPSKIAYFTTQKKFHYCQPDQNQPNFHILFNKDSLRDFYIMTLPEVFKFVLITVGNCSHRHFSYMPRFLYL